MMMDYVSCKIAVATDSMLSAMPGSLPGVMTELIVLYICNCHESSDVC